LLEPKARPNIDYGGIGHGKKAPPPAVADQVYTGFKAMERGVANELSSLIDFLNGSYAETLFERIDFRGIQRLAATCATGCAIVDPGPVEAMAATNGLVSRLVTRALGE
jgi:hypothetical protein